MAKILSGRPIRDAIKRDLAAKISKLKTKPTLVIIQVGEDAASSAYVGQKVKFGEAIGANVGLLQYQPSVTTAKLIGDIQNLNQDPGVQGIIVQLPLPVKIESQKVIGAISPAKDVDGFINKNVTPATARGVLTLLDYYKIKIAGQSVVVVGRSSLVGQPIARAMLGRNATVTIAHSQTKNLAALTREADILVVATGKPKLIDAKHVRPGQIIIDVGITRQEVGLVGDVNFVTASKIVKAISPVPGGVGPLTVASLFQNLLEL
jgi:methylenetetrahydrofolate dehydrogenase (NADP+)/methenyltetrahydrofolate cyclohydrolase